MGTSIGYSTPASATDSKRKNRWLKNTKVRATVNNVGDREPPLNTGGFAAGNQQN